jgi:trimeric autotransporter adhesin
MKKLLLLLFILPIYHASKAQVTLGNSPYTENFNNLESAGVPSGFLIRTAATAASLGNSATLTAGKSVWNNTSGAFKNVASATGLTATATTTEQDASTNRSLAIRQTGSFGDPGGAFVFQVTNTTAKSNFQLTFLLQSLDNTSPRKTTWIVDYGTGVAPTTFTTVATVPTPLETGNSTFSSNAITVNFGTLLDNIADAVTIRIWASTASTGSGNRGTTAIDDWNLSWSGVASVTNIIRNPNYIRINGNPSSEINIQFNERINADVQLQFFSIKGELVLQKRLGLVTEGQIEKISLGHLPKGLYMLSVKSKDGTFTTRVVN